MTRINPGFDRTLGAASVDGQRAARREGAEIAKIGKVRYLAGNSLQHNTLVLEHGNRCK